MKAYIQTFIRVSLGQAEELPSYIRLMRIAQEIAPDLNRDSLEQWLSGWMQWKANLLHDEHLDDLADLYWDSSKDLVLLRKPVSKWRLVFAVMAIGAWAKREAEIAPDKQAAILAGSYCPFCWMFYRLEDNCWDCPYGRKKGYCGQNPQSAWTIIQDNLLEQGFGPFGQGLVTAEAALNAWRQIAEIFMEEVVK